MREQASSGHETIELIVAKSLHFNHILIDLKSIVGVHREK